MFSICVKIPELIPSHSEPTVSLLKELKHIEIRMNHRDFNDNELCVFESMHDNALHVPNGVQHSLRGVRDK